MTKANVCHDRLCDWLQILEQAGLVQRLEEDAAVVFKTTAAGHQFLTHYTKLMDPLMIRDGPDGERVSARAVRHTAASVVSA